MSMVYVCKFIFHKKKSQCYNQEYNSSIYLYISIHNNFGEQQSDQYLPFIYLYDLIKKSIDENHVDFLYFDCFKKSC